MVNPQQPELRRNNRGTTSQDSKVPGAAGAPRNRGSSNADVGRPVPKGQVSPHGPADKQVADDESGQRG
ncbi:hypothetical protein ONA91_30010 [Micromonospora sp. DR5-3]|uniref:hypothetical protein n=1 Tax=unclassified Micromonospora TaxID=2617518 RepID=UPI0011D5694C|nr:MULTISPECIES: hypothetical protein [unclassified Micromonospora]MCW3818683.1 hypothetical protein [Micromonospora sp. DR5-3]TYC21118.1 hypothetical protein FXF52_27525 [Micromonospora sp. MP36]